MSPIPTSKNFLTSLLKEPDPDLRSQFTLERLIARAIDHGFKHLVLSRKVLHRGYRIWIDGEAGTFLPLRSEEVPKFKGQGDCFVGSVKVSGEEWLLQIRKKLGEVQLGYRAMSWAEGMLVQMLPKSLS